jgi:hypothetical protein
MFSLFLNWALYFVKRQWPIVGKQKCDFVRVYSNVKTYSLDIGISPWFNEGCIGFL